MNDVCDIKLIMIGKVNFTLYVYKYCLNVSNLLQVMLIYECTLLIEFEFLIFSLRKAKLL